MFKYNPEDARPWPAGTYPGKLVAVDSTEERIQLWWAVRNPQTGSVRKVCDTIQSSNLFKLRALASCLGASDAFDQGDFDPEQWVDMAVLWLTLKPSKGSLMSIARYNREKPKSMSPVVPPNEFAC